MRSTDEVVQIGTHEYALLLTANKQECAVVEKRLRHQWLERDPLEGSACAAGWPSARRPSRRTGAAA